MGDGGRKCKVNRATGPGPAGSCASREGDGEGGCAEFPVLSGRFGEWCVASTHPTLADSTLESFEIRDNQDCQDTFSLMKQK